MAYKETQLLRVSRGLFGILSHGMALAVACECLCPAPLHPGIPCLGSDTHPSGV